MINKMHQQRASLQELDTDDYFDNDGQYVIQHNKKNILQPINLNATNKRENTQVTQSTAISHHLMQGCGVGNKFQTQQSISNQSIANNFIDNSIQSKNIKDDQSETLYLTTQQSPKSTKNYSSSDQQQFSSMSQFQYICQKFQLKMEDIMQIMKGFQDKESKQMEESCKEQVIHQNHTPKENSLQGGINKSQIHSQLFNQLLVPQQNEMNLRFQSEVSQVQSLNENGEQEEQQFSEQAPSYNVNLNVNSNEGIQSNYHDSKQSSQDMPLQYNPYIFKTKNANDVIKQSVQQNQRDLQMQNYKQELQKSQQFANNSQNTDTSSISSRQNSYQLQNQINQINSGYMQKVDNQNNSQQISLKNEVKQQQHSQQSNAYSSFNNKNTSFSSKVNENNQKSDQYYETSLENQSEQQLQQQQEKEYNYKQSVYSDQSGENDSHLEVRFSNSDIKNLPEIPSNMRLLENDAEDFSCPMQFIKGGFIVYSINNGIKNFKVEEDNYNKQKDQLIATEINLFTSQSEQQNYNQDFENNQNQNKQISQGRQQNDFNNCKIQFDNEKRNQNNQVQNNNLNSEYLNQSDQKIDTQRSNQVNMQTEEISFTNQTFENRISRRFSEKNYLSNEYIQNNNKNSFSSSIQPQYTQERSDEEEQDYQQQIEDNDYAELERLRQLANGNSQIRIFTNRQSQYQKQLSQQDSKMQEANSNNSSQQQNGMSIKEMKMSKQYQDPLHQIGQVNYPSFNNSNQIFGYQTEEKPDQPALQQQAENYLEEYQSEQNYFNQNQQIQQQQNQILFNDNQQQNRNTFCNNSAQQTNQNSLQQSLKSHKNSQQQFGLESFGEISYPQPQQEKSNQYGLPNFQKEESFNDQFSQTFSQQNPSQNFDSLNLNGVYQNQEIGNARDSNYKQEGQSHSYYQNSTSIDQSQQGNSQNGHYYNQSNNSYQNYVAQMIDRYEEEIKRLQEQNQKQNLEIGELNGKIHGIQETKKDFELVIQSLKQNLQCVTDLLKKKEEDYNKLFDKYNTLVEQIQRSESKNKYRREISPNKEYNVQDSIDRHTIRQYDLRSSSSKENRNSQEKIIRSTESPNNILSQRDNNCMIPLMEKQTSRKNLNYENSQFSQFKPPMIKNPKKIINYDENNRKTLKREFSENQLGQRQFQQIQVVQKIVQNSLQNELKQDKENVQKFTKKTSLSPNQQDSRNNTNRSKSPSYGLNSARINDENQRYQESQKISTKRENLSGTRIQDCFLSSAKMVSNSQNRYSDQFKKQKSNSYLQTNNFVQQDKQVLDELRNYCFRKKQ
ncbi:endo-1,4-beta-xylanase xylA, putative (macronuclear) [Tetrahymena thermophila SB210]|uniref:Endo-1,4-beta-xylanase xylA, putative n=1 Tax=Tetrahymena thermophila (strain SB210) TaxID=312017 RepID=I7LVK2_TETTS|nr:endo-1,4-beta-xylanase xylA, putative [Tetrahymena thermophila SB210]EAR98390.2 endo-1,4-beta-xylanase xylA, putative [Tetrahymena thermophila SB210]|eukprot:XP_001018635.2 endo-1,4-beta-xylanase xylA, putative [Tetrahymena thermophila SB210]